MKNFIDLLSENSGLSVQKHPEWVSSQIEKMLSATGLNTWHLGDPVLTAGQRVLIGIAAWSAYDLRLLDALSQVRPDKVGAQERIDILDIDAASRASGGWDYFEHMIPGIGQVFHTPLVGIWENSTLTQKGSGAVGRDLIIDRYGLSRDQIIGQKIS